MNNVDFFALFQMLEWSKDGAHFSKNWIHYISHHEAATVG